MATSMASVANAAAQGCDDKTHEMMQAFQETILTVVPEEHQDAILTCSFDIVQAAQVCVASNKLQYEDDKKKMEKMIHELQGAVAKLQSDATTQSQDTPSVAAAFVPPLQKTLQPTIKAASKAKAPPSPPPLPASSSFALAVAVPATDVDDFDWNEDENQLGHSCGIEFAEPVPAMSDIVAVHPSKVAASERDDLASLESFKKQRMTHQKTSPFVHNSQFQVLESSAASSVTGPP